MLVKVAPSFDRIIIALLRTIIGLAHDGVRQGASRAHLAAFFDKQDLTLNVLRALLRLIYLQTVVFRLNSLSGASTVLVDHLQYFGHVKTEVGLV